MESTGPFGERRLSFVLSGGTSLSGTWARLKYPGGSRSGDSGWYYFDDKGIMQSGWICDKAGKWHYRDIEKKSPYGKMVTNWRLDAKGDNWYYLNPLSDAMA